MPPAPDAPPFLERYKYAIFAVLAVAVMAGIVVLLWQRPEPVTIQIIPPGPTEIPSATPTPGPYMVYVTGAVQRPEIVVTLDYGSRVFQAVEAAGGALDTADLERVNLAQILVDGDQVQIPTRQPGDETVGVAEVPLAVVTATPGIYTVYVVGEVAHPETLVSVPQGSRVEDAIEAAGGATGDADLARVNLGQILNDGDYVYVPPREGEPIQTPTPNHPAVIHVNYASVDELATLPGIGPSLAQAIVDYREANGPFDALEDLDAVSGIGPAKLEAIQDQVVFD